MRKTLFSIAVAAALLAGSGVVKAQTSTSTTTWTTDQGATIREYSTTQKYTSFMDPNLKPNVGMALPGTITLYPLPDSLKVQTPEQYSYGMINNQPVIVERTTRKVIHSWQ